MNPPSHPKLYHILHYDKLEWIQQDGFLYSDAILLNRPSIPGTTIGMGNIKERRLRRELTSHPGLTVGSCVPFYFCPRSVMLYLLFLSNHPDLSYRGGQDPIIHLEFDMLSIIQWAQSEGLRWAFTLSNAGSTYFEDRKNLESLAEINWNSVLATEWRHPDVKEGKQAEFLVEQRVPWTLIERIGVIDERTQGHVNRILQQGNHRPRVEIKRGWYY